MKFEKKNITKGTAENLYSTRLKTNKNIDYFDIYNLPKWNQDLKSHWSRPTTPSEIESVIKSLPTKKVSGQKGSAQNATRSSKKNQYEYSSNYF